MKAVLACLMLANAALFIFGAVQHSGVALGPFREPRIIPAAIVESICAISLLIGAISLARHAVIPLAAPLTGNLVAIAGVLLGMAALAVGRGPRTASNDLYHHIMLVLAGLSLIALFLARRG